VLQKQIYNMNAFEKFKNTYKGKKVLIMGLGLLGGGAGVAKIFAEIGAKVRVTDLKSKEELLPSLKKLKGLPIKFVLGKHRKEDFLNCDLIIRNPAVPKDSPFLQEARKRGVKISMDPALFAKFCPVSIIGVTGTRGKTTTASLIYELLKVKSKNILLGGNIRGMATLSLLKKIKDDSIVVLELSSWQLQGFDWEKISPHIAVITNIYEDHLNYYKDIKDYIEDKKLIFKYQTEKDFLFLNSKNKIVSNFAKEAKSKVFFFSKRDFPKNWNLKISGSHNLENAACAFKIGKCLDLSILKMRKVFENFEGVEGRLEKIAEIDGITYINDTASTMPVAGIFALRSIKKPIILIAGGASKNLDLSDFVREIVKGTKAIALLEGTATGELTDLIKKFGGKNKILGIFDQLKKAVFAAKMVADPGDTILLSPGCASFGIFKNEYDRGEQFNKIVKSFNP